MNEAQRQRVVLFLRRLQHLRVMPDDRSIEALDIRDVLDGQVVTVGYARNADFADSMNLTFEEGRALLREIGP